MGLLAFFMVLGFSSRAANQRILSPVASLAAASLLVTLDEVIQLAIPSRTFELKDLAWGLTGVLVFGLAAIGIQRIRHQYD
jgi:VanZ family protein